MRFTYLVVALVACGGDGSGSISIDDLPDQLVQAQCENQVKCGLAADQASCVASHSTDSTNELTTVAEVKAGKIKYDGGQAGKCIDAIKNESCIFGGFQTDHSLDACQNMFSGTVAAAGACIVDFDCAGLVACTATDPNCDASTTCCPGTCGSAAVTMGAGGACADDSECDTDLFCETGSGSSGTCTTPSSTTGAACDSFGGCANPLYCNIDFSTGSGTCVTSAGTGASCDPTQLIPCADSHEYCDATSMKCTPNIAVGGACDDTKPCVAFAECNTGSGSGSAGTCEANPTVGEACDDANGPSCFGDGECTNATCALPAAGMTCTL